MIQMNLQNRNRPRDPENKLRVASGEGWGEGIVREFGIDVYTAIFKIDGQRGPAV